MSFEYNGVVYRDLEPQVRYDAEQIQLLKQADVTLNESLQFMNEDLRTRINGKLTKPDNPSAESAVTMMADGTVGTKLLSDIGGGGGKLYLHELQLATSDDKTYAYVTIINSRSTEYPTNSPVDTGVTFNENIDRYFVDGYCVNNNRPAIDMTSGSNGQTLQFFADPADPADAPNRFITFKCCIYDAVTEL